MEWYFGNEVDDLVVPRDYEQAQMISSPESWPQWGMSGFMGSSFPKKNFNPNINMTGELMFNPDVNIGDSNNETSNSNNSSMTRELYNNGGSLLWNDQSEFQQFAEEEARINHMEDIFFNTLLEEDPTKDTTGPNANIILGNDANILEDQMVNSQYVESHGQSFGSSKYLKTHAFSPSTDWGNDAVPATYQMPKQYTSTGNMEESVLNDLERVTAQFPNKTRICFRDAFYRLAENSKQSLNSCLDESMFSMDDEMSAGGTESRTNVIDRAVASLVFHKKDYYDDAHQNLAQSSAY